MDPKGSVIMRLYCIHIRIALFQKFISPGELDPLNRRQVTETKPEVVVQGKHC